MERSVRLHSLSFGSVRTYLTALLLIAGNVALPQLFHMVPQGGLTWRMDLRPACGRADGLALACGQFAAVRDAAGGRASRHHA